MRQTRPKTRWIPCEVLESRRLLSGAGESVTGLIRTIEGVTFEQEGALNGSPGFGTIPPSPTVAAGGGYVVAAVNSAIQFFTTAGVKTYESNLFAFFQNQAFSELFDVRVMYDTQSSRWIVTALDQTAAPSVWGNRSSLFVAVSDDANPNGVWEVRSINTRLTIAGQQHYADFANIAMDTAGAIYVTANMHRFDTAAYGGSRLWIIDKAQLLTGTLAFTVHDPFAAASVASHPAGLATTHIHTGASFSGTYLINAGGYTDGSGNDQMLVIRVSNPLSSPTFVSSFLGMGGDVDQQATPLPGAPQQGTLITLRTDDRRVQHPAVWQEGELFFANTILPVSGPDAGQNTVRWYRAASPGIGAPPVLLEAGNIGGEELGAGTHTYFPSLSVDWNGNVVIGFNVSGSGLFASAAFVIRDSGGAVSAPTVFAAGQDYYVRTYVTPAQQPQNNLWGNYSTVAWDPTDGTFWSIQQYAGPRGGVFNGEDGRWRTRMAQVGVGVPGAPSMPDLLTADDSGASDSDNITNVNNPRFTGTAEPGATVQLRGNGTILGHTVASPAGEWTIQASALPDGTYIVDAYAENASGRGPLSASIILVIDTTPPQMVSSSFLFETTHAVAIAFNEDVSGAISPGNFTVTNTDTNTTLPTAQLSVDYDAKTDVATLGFPGVPGPPAGILDDGDYVLAFVGSIRDLAGNALVAPAPIEWFVFSGDANRDRSVDIGDFSILAARFNQPGTFSDGDFNYNGQVEIGDFSILAARFNTMLARSAAMSAFGAWSARPVVEFTRAIELISEEPV